MIPWEGLKGYDIKDAENCFKIPLVNPTKPAQDGKSLKKGKHLSCEVINTLFCKERWVELFFSSWNKYFAETVKAVCSKLCSLCAQHLISYIALHEMSSPRMPCESCWAQLKQNAVALTQNIWHNCLLVL